MRDHIKLLARRDGKTKRCDDRHHHRSVRRWRSSLGALCAVLDVEILGGKCGLIQGAFLLLIGSVLMGGCVERIQMIVGRIVTGLRYVDETSKK